jgi:hypothetical protein
MTAARTLDLFLLHAQDGRRAGEVGILALQPDTQGRVNHERPRATVLAVPAASPSCR